MKIEQQIISRLLYKPKEIHSIELKPKWFKQKDLQEIAKVLVELDGKELYMTEMVEAVKEKAPLTKHTVDTLENMRAYGLESNQIERYQVQLQNQYLTDKVVVATAEYSRYPDSKNYQKLQDAMRVKQEAEIPTDDGSLESTFEDIFHELENDVFTGIKTYPKVDHILGGGMQGGMLITIGARTGVGKTAYGINLAIQALTRQKDIRMDFFTLEMSKKQMTKRFLSRLTEINSYKLRNPNKDLTDDQKALVVGKSHELLSKHLKIYDSNFSMNNIEIEIRRNHFEAGDKPYIAFIDYLQLVDSGNAQAQRYVQVGEITRKLKQLTNELDIPIVIFAQLSRGIENRQDKTPILADLRESGSIEQDSNVVMFLYSEEEDNERIDESSNETIVSVAKNREGFTGDIKYRFLKTKMYFKELDE